MGEWCGGIEMTCSNGLHGSGTIRAGIGAVHNGVGLPSLRTRSRYR